MKKIIIASLLVLGMGSAFAGDMYVTAGVGSTTVGGTQAIGVGMKLNDKVAIETAYRNFNGNDTTGGTVRVGTPDPVTGACPGCYFESDSMTAKMSGIELTAKYNVTENVYARGGVMYRSATIDEKFAPSKSLSPISYTDTGFGPVAGIGATAYGFAIELTTYGSIMPSVEGKNLVVGTNVSYSYSF